LERVYRRKDGTTFPVEVIVSQRNFEGQDYILAVARDISHQKRLEAQLRQAQKLEAVGQLAAGVAHNFNNMLTAVMGYVGLALDTLPANHPIASDLEGVQKTAQRAANLTHQLLAFTRTQNTQPRLFNLNELVINMKSMLRQLISETIQLEILPAPDLGWVKIDTGLFEQVLINLVVNARDAMPEGGKLILATTNVTLDTSYASQSVEVLPGNYVKLSVTDTGCGMTPEIKEHIFEPFFTTKEVGKGTGLGLATCFGIVKQSQGHIVAQSEPDQGTTFEIYLPRVEEIIRSFGSTQKTPQS
jgi:two-component system, cell cycle sensor histidine kinase and response regulator CckA